MSEYPKFRLKVDKTDKIKYGVQIKLTEQTRWTWDGDESGARLYLMELEAIDRLNYIENLFGKQNN